MKTTYSLPPDRPLGWLRRQLDANHVQYDAITFSEHDGRLYIRVSKRNCSHKWVCDFVERCYPEATFDSIISDIYGMIHCEYRMLAPVEEQAIAVTEASNA